MVKKPLTAVRYRALLLGGVVNNERRPNLDVANDGDSSEEDPQGEVIDPNDFSMEEEDKEIIFESNHSESSTASFKQRGFPADKKLKGVGIEQVRGGLIPCSNVGKGKAVLDRTGLLAGTEDSRSSELKKQGRDMSEQFGGRSNNKSLVGSWCSTGSVDVICISDDDD